jgi:ABC-type glutathione transport system ATPase component
MADWLIEADAVSRSFPLRDGSMFRYRSELRAVDRASIAIAPGETVALVGESGSGKSTLGRMLLGLLSPSAGIIRYRGTPLDELRDEERRRFRREVQAVFQDTGASLNPRRTVAQSIAVPLRWNRGLDRQAAMREIASLLERVTLPAVEFQDRLPHMLSGGQRQRVGIARALASEPALIVADEPVSALDVSIRAQVLRLIRQLQLARGLALLFITHDLGVVRAIADRVVVMRLGVIVEQGSVESVLRAPTHEYTRTLIAAMPVADPDLAPSQSL